MLAGRFRILFLYPRWHLMRFVAAVAVLALVGCAGKDEAAPAAAAQPAGGLAAVEDDNSAKDVVKIAAGSPDHVHIIDAVVVPK